MNVVSFYVIKLILPRPQQVSNTFAPLNMGILSNNMYQKTIIIIMSRFRLVSRGSLYALFM